MKTYEETARTVLERVEEFNEKKKRRNRIIRPIAAFACIAIFAVTAVFGVKAMMKLDTVTPKNENCKKLVATLVKSTYDEHTVSSEQGDPEKQRQMAYYYDETAPKNATVTVGGKEYIGTYVKTYSFNAGNIELYPADARSYRVDADTSDRVISFYLNAETGELMMFHNSDSTFLQEPKNPESNKAIAESYAAQFLGERIDDYVMETGISRFGLYYWEYYRVIDGYRTTDELYIVIGDDGQMVRLETGYLGTFNGIDSLPFSMEDAENVVKEMIAEIGGGAQYEYTKIIPTVLKDGKIGVIYKVLFPVKGREYCIIVSLDE